MGRLVGMSATNAHMELENIGFRVNSTRLNPGVIFVVYSRAAEMVVLMIDVASHIVSEVV